MTETRTMRIEAEILDVLHTLSADRTEQVLDFARFLQYQDLLDQPKLHEGESEEDVFADNERWEATFAASPATLKHLAQKAKEEIRTGRTHGMRFTEEGTIEPQ